MQASDVQCFRCWSHVCPLLSRNEIFQWVVCVSERVYLQMHGEMSSLSNTLSASDKVKVKGSHRKSSAVHLASRWWPALTILERVEATYLQYKCSRMLIDRLVSLVLLSLNSCPILWFSFFSFSLLAVKEPRHVSSDRFVLSKVLIHDIFFFNYKSESYPKMLPEL